MRIFHNLTQSCRVGREGGFADRLVESHDGNLCGRCRARRFFGSGSRNLGKIDVCEIRSAGYRSSSENHWNGTPLQTYPAFVSSHRSSMVEKVIGFGRLLRAIAQFSSTRGDSWGGIFDQLSADFEHETPRDLGPAKSVAGRQEETS